MTDNDFIPKVPNALPPSYRFDEFEIQEAIDASMTSILYRAWDSQLERVVAIREYMPKAYVMRNDVMELVLHSERDHMVFATGLNEFIQEARQLAHFNHPNLPQVLRVWSDNNTAYLVTLFYSGVSLDELQKQQPSVINEVWIRRMLPMLCGALATLHSADHLHRNVSLKSILIQDNGLPILLNAGATRRGQGASLDEGNTLLHPGFAPLEQYTGDLASQLGPWTDIYAVGAVLYTLIVGSAPPASVARSIQDSCLILAENRPEGYSLNLLQAIDKALSLKPEDRPQSIDEFAALLDIPVGDVRERVSNKKTGTALVAVEEPEAATALPLWQRHRSTLQTAAAAVAGLVVGALLFGRSTEPAAPQVSSAEPVVAASAAPASPAPAATAPDGSVARIYIRMNDGEQLLINGKEQKVTVAANGFASLQLPAGKYLLTLSGGEQTRKQTIVVANPGTWLVNPQG